MTAKDYSSRYDLALNFKKVAELAFNAGLKEGRNEKTDIVKLKKELKETKKELKSLYDTLYDPEKCGEFIAGL